MWLLSVAASLAMPPRPPPPPPLSARAADVGLPDETVAQLESIEEAARDEVRAAKEAAHEAREALHTELGTNNPDRNKVLLLSARVGEAEQHARDLHLTLLLDLRQVLTPAAWEAVAPPGPPPASF